MMTLPTDSDARKNTPIWSGVIRYFPDALAAVARLSKKANDKHNPGEPMHWSRGKSNDHGDCLLRHQVEPEKLDEETGELHAAAVAWRALAQLQLLEEARRLNDLAGPMGRVDAAAPEPGVEWERGANDGFQKGAGAPKWATPTTLVDYRRAGEDGFFTAIACDLAFHCGHEYRKHQG